MSQCSSVNDGRPFDEVSATADEIKEICDGFSQMRFWTSFWSEANSGLRTFKNNITGEDVTIERWGFQQPNELYTRDRATLLECYDNFFYHDTYLNKLYSSGAVCIVDHT